MAELLQVMWALFNSPLIMSNDLPNIGAASKKLLLNTEIIGAEKPFPRLKAFQPRALESRIPSRSTAPCFPPCPPRISILSSHRTGAQ